MKTILLMIKFIILAIIYLFILRVFYFIVTDLRRRGNTVVGRLEASRASSGAELVVIGGNDPSFKQGEVICLGRQTCLGRGHQNNIKLTSSFASHNHARIIFQDDRYFLEDLNSINGTYINGVRVSEAVPLVHGDTIAIAGLTFKFVRWEYEVE
ncbi:FHA domain-containing protein [Phosphitispora sp. TUW77]|uniref:FHA domain-containing protein n=1 Tax=Phosphitispora sp. TUW77 TaxID=3152361 RepID=UPI003AB48680